MLAVLSDVVRNIVVLIILVTIVEMLLPRKDFRPFINMVVGLALMLMLLAPLRSLLQLPGVLDPVLELHEAITEDDVTNRQSMLEQMNWDLTLTRYRQLVEEKINETLQAEGLEIVTVELEVEEDVNHLEFGVPRQIKVWVQKMTAAGKVEPIEPIEVDLNNENEEQLRGERNTDLERQVAEVLGITQDIVEIRVLV